MPINLKEHTRIENNYFGYIYYGIKILNYSEGYKLLNYGSEIGEGDILLEEVQLELVSLNGPSHVLQSG